MTTKRRWLIDIDFLLKHGLTFDLWHLKFGVYNWTAREFDSDLANVERQPEFQEIEALNYCPSVIRFLTKDLQSVILF